MPTHSKHSLLATLVPLIVTFRNHPSSTEKKVPTSISIAIIIYKFSTSIVIVITRILFNFPVSFFLCPSPDSPLSFRQFSSIWDFFLCSVTTQQPAAAAVAFYCRSDSINVFLLYYVASLRRWLQGTPNVVADPPMRHGESLSCPLHSSFRLGSSLDVYPPLECASVDFPCARMGCYSGLVVDRPSVVIVSTMDWHLKFTRR